MNIQNAILEAIESNPGTNPSSDIQIKYGLSRQAVLFHINELIQKEKIRAEGKNKGRVYFPLTLKNPREETFPETTPSFQIQKELKGKISRLAEQGEHEIYRSDIAPELSHLANQGLETRIQYVSTEILNNIIDHSQGKDWAFHLSSKPDHIRLQFEDDGIGVFQSIQRYFGNQSTWEAIGELAKGKRTSDPTRHAGEGLFFSARMADLFSIEANELQYIYNSAQDDWTMRPSKRRTGSLLTLDFDLNDRRSTKEVFDRFTEDFDFKANSPRLVDPFIVQLPAGHLPSRSEAKKILAGSEKFTSIVFDFKGVESIGQGFADEVFRIFARDNPGTQIEIKNANEFIQRMIAHVRRPTLAE